MSPRRPRSASLKQNTLFDGGPPRALVAIVAPNCAMVGAPGSSPRLPVVISGAINRSSRRTRSAVRSGTSRDTTPACCRALGQARSRLEIRRHGASRLRRRHDGNTLEVDDVLPLPHPLLDQPDVVALHHL